MVTDLALGVDGEDAGGGHADGLVGGHVGGLVAVAGVEDVVAGREEGLDVGQAADLELFGLLLDHLLLEGDEEGAGRDQQGA